MTLDTSLSKLTRHAYTILSGAYAKMPEIAIAAIDVPNTPKQPLLYNQLIQVSTLFRQINTHIVYNNDNTAIIGIQGEDVDVINDLLYCLRDVAGLTGSSQFPTPFTNLDFTQVQYIPILPGPLGSIMVSDGTAWQILNMGNPGSVLTATPTGLIYSNVVGNGLPAGGTAGQFLIKNTNNSYDVIWSSLTLNQITDIDETPAELNVLDGVDTVNIGSSQINTLNGINTGTTIQIQLDSKMDNSLPNGQFWVGNISNIATPVTPSGDVVFDNTGLFAIQPNVIVDADVNTNAGITRSKLASGTSYRLVVNNNAGVMSEASAIFPARALISDANGIPTHSDVTATVLGYISTLTSNAQNQLNSKLTVVLTSVAQGDVLWYNGTNWVNLPVGASGEVITTDGTSVSWGSATANGIPAGGTAQQVLRKIDATNYNTEWHTLVMADISDVVTTATELNLLSGLTVDSTQLNYTANVHTDIQQQLDNKQSRVLTYHSIWIGGAGDTAQQTSAGADGSVLMIVSGHPTWQSPPPPGDISGPGISSSTDNAIARWNGTDGNSIQNSIPIIDDGGNISLVTSLSTGQVSILNQAELRLYETGSVNYVGIRATGVMAGNYTITLPEVAPTPNTSLTYDGANYVWAASGGAIAFTDLTDVPSSYAGFAGYVVRVTATEDGLEFVAGGGAGSVTSVSGTADRITITGTPTINPTVDIASTYAGQPSITTLGTITTGVWNGTDIALSAGGTGATLSAPGVDRIFFYDQSALSSAFLEVGSGLSITGTVLTATGSYDNEQAQDAIGNILLDSSTIDFTYNDATPSITAIVINNSIGDAQLRQGSALSLIGRSVNSPGNVSDISASTDGFVMRRSGAAIGFGTISATGSMTMSSNRILGRTTAAIGPVEELQVLNGLTLSSGAIKLGGTLINDTFIVGSGFSYGGSGFSAYQIAADTEITHSTTFGTGVRIRAEAGAIHQLFLGETSGPVLNLGGDATGDMYYRDSDGKFRQLIIGLSGQTLITNDISGTPTWSNMPIEPVDTTTYLFTDEDNGKLKVFTHGSGCLATIPDGGVLQPGWQVLCYRLGGTVTFASAGDLEGVGTTMPVIETMASIIQRDTDIFALSGSLSLIGSGTVTSVGLNPIPGIISVSGSPVTTVGAFTMTLDNQSANYGFFGPAISGSAAPTFRAMVLKDLPNDTYSEISGLTYTFAEGDNKLVKYVTNPSGCIITIPSGLLSVGWASTVYRMPGAGSVSFVSDGTSTLEGISFIMATEETLAIVSQRATNIFIVAGELGVPSGGGIITADNGLILSGTNVSWGGSLVSTTSISGGNTFGVGFLGLNGFLVNVGGGNPVEIFGAGDALIYMTGNTEINPSGTLTLSGQFGSSSIHLTADIDIETTGNIDFSGATYTLNNLAPGSPSTMFFRGDGTWAVPGGGGTVTSVSGTTNRISVTGTAADPIIDIHANYVGQPSITTLGTVTTGTWNGTPIAIAYGGTGLTALGAANRVLGVNNAATALEYKAFSMGTTAQSNDLGWVLTSANAIVLHVPNASATVRGVVTTGAQTFAGVKTFSSAPVFSTMTAGSVLFAGSGGVLTQDNASLFFDNTQNRLGLGTTTPQRNLDVVATINGVSGVAVTNNDTGSSGIARFSAYNSSNGLMYMQMYGTNATTYPNMGLVSSTGAALLINTFFDFPIRFGTNFSVDPTDRARLTTTGLYIGGNTNPSARLHIVGGSTTVAPVKLTTGTALSSTQDGALEYHASHLYFTIGSIRYQLDQQSGTLADGDKGDITVSGSGATWIIDNDAVTYAKIQNVAANNTFLGRISGAAGNIEELTGTQATVLLDLFSTSATTKGLVPGSNGVGATFYLDASGAWSVPTGGGGTPGGSNTHVQFNSSGSFGGNSGMTYAESPTGTFGLSLGTASTTNIGKLTLGGATGSGNITANADLSINLSPTTNGFRIIMGGNNRFQLNNNGAALFNSAAGTLGQVLTSAGTGAPPTWTTPFTNTAANFELPKSDGADLIPSGIYVISNGSLSLGSSAVAGATRTITGDSSGATVDIDIYPKGAGDVEFATTTGIVYIGGNAFTGDRILGTGSSSTNAKLTINPKAAGDLEFGTTTGIIYAGSNGSTGSRSIVIGTSSSNGLLSIHGKGSGGAITMYPRGSVTDSSYYLSMSAGLFTMSTAESATNVEAFVVDNITHNARFSVWTSATAVNLIGGYSGAEAIIDFNILAKSGASGDGANLTLAGGGAGSGDTKGDLILKSDAAGVGTRGYLIIQDLPTSSAGLPTGAVWNNLGILTIV